MDALTPPTLESLLVRVAAGKNGCWIWTGALDGKGYGNVGRSHNYGQVTKNWAAHRLIYELSAGTIPVGYELHHRCEVRRCVNPDHLEPVTRREHHGKNGRHADHMRPAIEASVAARKRRGRLR